MLPYNISGVIYLSTNYSSYSPDFLKIFFIILSISIPIGLLIAFLIISISDTDSKLWEDKSFKNIFCIAIGFFFIGLFILKNLLSEEHNFVPEPISYEIMITDEVNYNELTEHYNVINTQENIITIEVK